MPVKSTRFKTQTIFDGEITGLNEREKNVLKKAGIGGGGGDAFDVVIVNDDYTEYTGTITNEKPILIKDSTGKISLLSQIFENLGGTISPIFISTISSGKVVQLVFRDGKITSYDVTIFYSHFITLTSSTLGSINFNYTDTNNNMLTIDDLKSALAGKSVTCSGYIKSSGANKFAKYIAGEADELNIGWFDISDGSTGSTTIDSTFSISDNPTPVE